MKTNLLKTGIAFFCGAVISINSLKAITYTAVTSGSWSSAATWGGVGPGTNPSTDDIVIPMGLVVTLDQDINFAGVINSLTINGVLSSTTTNQLIMTQGNLAGSGTINIDKINFGNSAFVSSTFNGTMNVKTIVNNGANLILGSVMNITDTLDLESGSIVLNTGGNLTLMNDSWIRFKNGTLVISGGVFNQSNLYNVMYVGASKTSGIELSTTAVKKLVVNLDNNTQTLTLANDVLINSTFSHTFGYIDLNGNKLTLQSDYIAVNGVKFISTNADFTIEGSSTTSSAISFTNGSSLNDLTLTMTGAGKAEVGGDLTINGDLILNDGDLEIKTGATLIMGAGSTIHIHDGAMIQNGGTFNGAALYNVAYMGTSTSTGVELNGAGLNDVTIDLNNSSLTVTLSDNLLIAGTFSLLNGKLNLNGKNLTLNGNFSSDASGSFTGGTNSDLTLNLAQSINDTIRFDASNAVINKLTLNFGSNTVLVLASALTVMSELNLTSGQLLLVNNDLTIAAAASIMGYDESYYIITNGNGRLIMYVNTSAPYVVFPVGTTVNYSPAYVQQTSLGTSGNFMVRVMPGVYAQGTTGTNYASTMSLVDRTWLIESAANVNMNLKLGWKASSQMNGFDLQNAFISHYMNSSWDTYASGPATVVSNVYVIERTNITALSPFAVADDNATLKVNEQPIVGEFNLYPNPTNEIINLEITGDGNLFRYEVIDLLGKTLTSLSNSNSVNRFDVSEIPSGYYFIKATNLNTNATLTKKFVKE